MDRENDIRLMNETFLEYLSTPGMEKRALDAVNDFTRLKMREDGFFRKILPPIQISDEDLDRQVDTDKLVKVVDMEPDSPAAISVPFATLPINEYIRGPRYRVMFDRVESPRFVKDVDELRTWYMDIRQVLSDNAIKDMLAAEDGSFLFMVNYALVGPGSQTRTGAVQWEQIAGGLDRSALQDAFKILPRTSSRLEVTTCLVNNLTIREIMKWGRDELGGDRAQDLLWNGWREADFMGARWIITIKHDLVPENTIFMFADPKFMGKFYILEDTTMYVKREAFMLEFFAYETIGATIGNVASLARADFV